jgi:hypothetical protein
MWEVIASLYGLIKKVQIIYRFLDNLRTCLSKTGKSCIFPFKYGGLNYTKCTTKNRLYGTWCATKLDANGILYGNMGIDADYCSEDCLI